MKIKLYRNTLLTYFIFLFSCSITTSKVVASDHSNSALVKILISDSESQTECHGVAITQRTILTAAHCIVEKASNAVQVINYKKKSGISGFKLHPNFNSSTRLPRFDIALLTTNEVMTDSPLPIIVNTNLNSGQHFSLISSLDNNSSNQNTNLNIGSEMIVADIERTILNFIQLKRGAFPHPEMIEDLERRLKNGDPQIRSKIMEEFGGFIFSLYSKNNNSICLGDSGSPAVVEKNGRPGVIGVATAVSDLEDKKNPACPEGGTSIFTSLSQKETIFFIRSYNPEIEFH